MGKSHAEGQIEEGGGGCEKPCVRAKCGGGERGRKTKRRRGRKGKGIGLGASSMMKAGTLGRASSIAVAGSRSSSGQQLGLPSLGEQEW
jgi:hypothetical protein